MTEDSAEYRTDETTPEPAEDAAQAPEDTLEALRSEAAENWNKYLRAVAELDNLRKRNVRDVENARKYGIERFAEAIVPVRDSIEAALAAAGTASVESLLEGQQATLRLLDQALRSAGIAEIDPHGEPFDPTKHEAISMLPAPHAEPNSVIEVVQKGYEIHERLVRPARVVVAQPPQDDTGE
jgi:molecular chaperone GrpE